MIKQCLSLPVGWWLTQLAKVVGGRDQASAEEVMPEPIDHHPAGQRVSRVEHPVGQFQPTGGMLGPGRLVRPVDRLQKSPR